MTDGGFDLTQVYVHLGRGSRAETLPDFSWTPETLRAYELAHAADGEEGRLVMIGEQSSSWTGWERHPAGDELVVQLSGRSVLVQDLPEGERRIELGPGQAAINRRGSWHTAEVLEPGRVLFVTPGRGTEHRPR